MQGREPTTHSTMHDDTIRALQQLAEALIANPADVKELQVYGELPDHLADALHDFTENHMGFED